MPHWLSKVTVNEDTDTVTCDGKKGYVAAAIQALNQGL